MRSSTGKVTAMKLKDKLSDIFRRANTESELGELKDIAAGAYDEVWMRDESGNLVRQEVSDDDAEKRQ